MEAYFRFYMIKILKSFLWELSTRIKILRKHQLPAIRHFLDIQKSIRNGKVIEGELSHNLLVLAWMFPPQVTAGVYRPASFVKHMAENGWSTVVLASTLSDEVSDAGKYLATSIPSAVSVSRLSTSQPYVRAWPLPDVDGGILNALTVYEEASELIRTMKPGVILASGPPFHNFVAGMWLAKRFGWRLALDYRDEWSECPFDFVKKDAANRRWETQCIQSANSIIFTTQAQIEHQLSRFSGLSRDKCALVSNGWRPEDFDFLPNQCSEIESGKLSIAYLGNLGPMASPSGFLSMLTQVLDRNPDLRARLRVKLIGKKSNFALREIEDHPYRDNFVLTDHITKLEACRLMTEVDGLLLLNPPGVARYIQGKLYEYIASGTTVIVFGEGGEMGAIVDELGSGVSIRSNSVEDLEAALLSLGQKRSFNRVKVEAWLKTRQRNEIAQDMRKVLDAVRSGKE